MLGHLLCINPVRDIKMYSILDVLSYAVIATAFQWHNFLKNINGKSNHLHKSFGFNKHPLNSKNLHDQSNDSLILYDSN